MNYRTETGERITMEQKAKRFYMNLFYKAIWSELSESERYYIADEEEQASNEFKSTMSRDETRALRHLCFEKAGWDSARQQLADSEKIHDWFEGTIHAIEYLPIIVDRLVMDMNDAEVAVWNETKNWETMDWEALKRASEKS